MNRTLALIALALTLAACNAPDPDFGGHDPEAGLAPTDHMPTTAPVATK
jgi:hypothetical protein